MNFKRMYYKVFKGIKPFTVFMWVATLSGGWYTMYLYSDIYRAFGWFLGTYSFTLLAQTEIENMNLLSTKSWNQVYIQALEKHISISELMGKNVPNPEPKEETEE